MTHDSKERGIFRAKKERNPILAGPNHAQDARTTNCHCSTVCSPLLHINITAVAACQICMAQYRLLRHASYTDTPYPLSTKFYVNRRSPAPSLYLSLSPSLPLFFTHIHIPPVTTTIETVVSKSHAPPPLGVAVTLLLLAHAEQLPPLLAQLPGASGRTGRAACVACAGPWSPAGQRR